MALSDCVGRVIAHAEAARRTPVGLPDFLPWAAMAKVWKLRLMRLRCSRLSQLTLKTCAQHVLHDRRLPAQGKELELAGALDQLGDLLPQLRVLAGHKICADACVSAPSHHTTVAGWHMGLLGPTNRLESN